MAAMNKIQSGNNWVQILETKEKTFTFLDKRIKELTNQLETNKITYAQKSACHRIKWVAQIIFQAFRVIVFFLLEKTASLFRLKKFERLCALKVNDAYMHIGAFAFRFKCYKELVITAHNNHDLNASKIFLERNIKMDGKPFDTLQVVGKCWGMNQLFTILFLKAKEKYPDLKLNQLILAIASLFRTGAPPEASIMQNFQGDRWLNCFDLFTTFFKDFRSIRDKYPSWIIEKKDVNQKNLRSIEILNQLEVGQPYEVKNRVFGLHSSLLIRSAEKEFFFFDPNVGLSVYRGDKGIRKVTKMAGYERVSKRQAFLCALPSNAIKIQHFFEAVHPKIVVGTFTG